MRGSRASSTFAAREQITVLESHIYYDEAQSGSVRARPGLEALKKAAEDKQFDAVLVGDSSRLSRDNQHFNKLLCLFGFWGISLISVSDGLDIREEHAKIAYQFRGIICLNASRRARENKVLIARKRLEDKVVAALNEKILNPEVYERTARR